MSGRLVTFRTNVLTAIQQLLPTIKSCSAQYGRFDLAELEREMMNAPAVRLAILRAPLEFQAKGNGDAQLQMAAFIITEGKDREAQAWNIAESIASLLHPGQLFGMTKISGPSKVSVAPVISASIKQRGVGVMAVEWTQAVRGLGDVAFKPDGAPLPDVELNDEAVVVSSQAVEDEGSDDD